ncbi:hypothetical protein BDR26DRAFT_993093 [Obelidium mucronatum]|nr:hypothetical protein BDR26DRAFT_993093 [Obelidium mucronatum]
MLSVVGFFEDSRVKNVQQQQAMRPIKNVFASITASPAGNFLGLSSSGRKALEKLVDPFGEMRQKYNDQLSKNPTPLLKKELEKGLEQLNENQQVFSELQRTLLRKHNIQLNPDVTLQREIFLQKPPRSQIEQYPLDSCSEESAVSQCILAIQIKILDDKYQGRSIHELSDKEKETFKSDQEKMLESLLTISIELKSNKAGTVSNAGQPILVENSDSGLQIIKPTDSGEPVHEWKNPINENTYAPDFSHEELEKFSKIFNPRRQLNFVTFDRALTNLLDLNNSKLVHIQAATALLPNNFMTKDELDAVNGATELVQVQDVYEKYIGRLLEENDGTYPIDPLLDVITDALEEGEYC